MCICVVFMWGLCTGVQVPQEVRGGRQVPYELPHGFWERNPGPLQEQPMLLTTEPSLQFTNDIIINISIEGLELDTQAIFSCFLGD